jgi:hypothetical protein
VSFRTRLFDSHTHAELADYGRTELQRIGTGAGKRLRAVLIAAISSMIFVSSRYGVDRGQDAKLSLTGFRQFTSAVVRGGLFAHD